MLFLHIFKIMSLQQMVCSQANSFADFDDAVRDKIVTEVVPSPFSAVAVATIF